MTPTRGQDTLLETSWAGHRYVLSGENARYTVTEDGRRPLLLSRDPAVSFDALSAIGSGWIAAGRRETRSGPGSELVLLRGDGGSLEMLPTPPSGASSLRSPQPLVEGGDLVGLLWLEGSEGSALGVRAAAWDGTGFSAAEWVSEPADGSQLALSATVLGDGSWLAVWSAYDGQDDEILWSRREGGAWTRPARVHADNAVPDITPVVAATRRGAVVAWSRYEDGHYRVRMARFGADAWLNEQRLGGPGSVFPFFVVDEEAPGPRLVFQDGVKGDWDLVELGPAGQVASRSRFSGELRRRPLVRRGPAGSARLEWPDTATDARRRSAP